MEATAKKRSFVKVRCSQCGHISWWLRKSPYLCTQCGSKHGMIVNLLGDALKQRRLAIQENLANQARIDAFLQGQEDDARGLSQKL